MSKGGSRAFILILAYIWLFTSFVILALGQETKNVLDLKNDCGAVGDDKHDDSPALASCLGQVNLGNGNERYKIIVPSGVYRIGPAAPNIPVLLKHVAIVGDGPSNTIFHLDAKFSGSLFSWSETWVHNSFSAETVNLDKDLSTIVIAGFKVVGNRNTKVKQSALTFYDRNDFVLLRDLEIQYINGPCISIGKTLNVSQAYMRESSFFDVKCWSSGSDEEAAVEISSATAANSDATNELDFYKLAIFAAKTVGLSIRNPNPFSATRKIRFFGLRVEQSGGDDVEVAPAPDIGQVAEIDFYSLSALTAGSAGLRIGGNAGARPYAISIHGGLFGPGNKIGVEIDNGRLIDIELSGLDAPIVLGPGSGTDVSIHGNGSEYDWRVQGVRVPGEEAVPLNLRSPYGLFGLPNAGAQIGAAALKGKAIAGQSVRLTMDGGPADAYNCFNPSYSQIFNLDIQLMAVDHAAPDRFYAWRMPLSVLSAWTGAGAAKFTPGEATARGISGASVEVGPDTKDGCLALTFSPPKSDTADWDVTAALHFARAP